VKVVITPTPSKLQVVGDTETKPKSYSVNYFIKVN